MGWLAQSRRIVARRAVFAARGFAYARFDFVLAARGFAYVRFDFALAARGFAIVDPDFVHPCFEFAIRRSRFCAPSIGFRITALAQKTTELPKSTPKRATRLSPRKTDTGPPLCLFPCSKNGFQSEVQQSQSEVREFSSKVRVFSSEVQIF